jgi:ubiquinone/menaquinone biosynthesis C-methylase UbiE
MEVLRESGTKRYDRLHERWQIKRYRSLSPFYVTRRRIVERFVAEYATKGICVLDVGCGIGDIVPVFDSRAEFYLGIDLSKHALEVASKNFRSKSFLLAVANALPIKQESFDLVICTEVLEHLEQDAEAVGEISRVLRNQGLAILTVPQNPKYWTHEDAFDRHLRRYEAPDLVHMLQIQHLKTEKLLSWGFPLAFLFRKYISTKLFNARVHESLTTNVRTERAVRTMAKVLSHLFRFDNLFNDLNLGLGIAAVARKVAGQ